MLNNGTTFLTITVRAQNKMECIFYKNVLDISLGLKLYKN